MDNWMTGEMVQGVGAHVVDNVLSLGWTLAMASQAPPEHVTYLFILFALGATPSGAHGIPGSTVRNPS